MQRVLHLSSRNPVNEFALRLGIHFVHTARAGPVARGRLARADRLWKARLRHRSADYAPESMEAELPSGGPSSSGTGRSGRDQHASRAQGDLDGTRGGPHGWRRTVGCQATSCRLYGQAFGKSLAHTDTVGLFYSTGSWLIFRTALYCWLAISTGLYVRTW